MVTRGSSPALHPVARPFRSGAPQLRLPRIGVSFIGRLVLAVAVVLFALVVSVVVLPGMLAARDERAAKPLPDPPREWVWRKQAIDFEDMYGSGSRAWARPAPNAGPAARRGDPAKQLNWTGR